MSKRPLLISARNSTCRRLKPLSSMTRRMLSCGAGPAWQQHPSAWILELPTDYGIQARRLFVVASFFVGFGMCMLWSDNALAEVETSDSSAAPGGTLLASTSSAEEQNPYEWGHELLPTDESVKPVNIAHRGGAKIGPENTLVGFQKGLLVGAHVLELDVHLTADAQLVVIHNKTVDDTTNGTGLVRNMTLQKVKRLDAGYDFTGNHGKTHPYRGKGVVVPTLEEVYQAFPGVPL